MPASLSPPSWKVQFALMGLLSMDDETDQYYIKRKPETASDTVLKNTEKLKNVWWVVKHVLLEKSCATCFSFVRLTLVSKKKFPDRHINRALILLHMHTLPHRSQYWSVPYCRQCSHSSFGRAVLWWQHSCCLWIKRIKNSNLMREQRQSGQTDRKHLFLSLEWI